MLPGAAIDWGSLGADILLRGPEFARKTREVHDAIIFGVQNIGSTEIPYLGNWEGLVKAEIANARDGKPLGSTLGGGMVSLLARLFVEVGGTDCALTREELEELVGRAVSVALLHQAASFLCEILPSVHENPAAVAGALSSLDCTRVTGAVVAGLRPISARLFDVVLDAEGSGRCSLASFAYHMCCVFGDDDEEMDALQIVITLIDTSGSGTLSPVEIAAFGE